MRAFRSTRSTDGFSLVELLVVIVIISVLAAIAVPTFLAHRERGYRTTALADMRNVAIALETFATTSGGDFSGLDGADEDNPVLRAEGFRSSHWVALSIEAETTSYCVVGINEKVPGKQFVLRSDSGRVVIDLEGSAAC